MRPERQIEVWQNANELPKECKYSDLKKILEYFGFVYVRKTTHTHMWKHPELKDHGEFSFGRVQVGEHYRGIQGMSSEDNIRDVIAAVRGVLEVRSNEED